MPGEFQDHRTQHLFVFLQLLNCEQLELIGSLTSQFVMVLLMDHLGILFFVALEKNGFSDLLGKGLIYFQNGGLNEGELLELGSGRSVFAVDGPSPFAFFFERHGGFFKHGLGIFMILFDVCVEGRVGKVGLSARAMEISADQISSVPSKHII